jgi:proteasome accessory factor B
VFKERLLRQVALQSQHRQEPDLQGVRIVTVVFERLINLALFLAASREPVTAERIRTEVFGFPEGQDEPAFLRMFERDKDSLRRMGFAIVADERGRYSLDASATFVDPLDLTPIEAAAVRVAGTALLGDPSFPYAEDLRLALAKISAQMESTGPPSAGLLVDEAPDLQGRAVESLSRAIDSRKMVRFDYTNSTGESGTRELDPYGLFLYDGRWYVVGRDRHRDEVRTYAVLRMADLEPSVSRPKTPDFDRPDTFDISEFRLLPFQFGSAEDEFEALVLFAPSAAWRAGALAAGQGLLETRPDGAVEWRVRARNAPRLLAFILEHGPGVAIAAPAELTTALADGLGKVVRAHD